MTGAVVVRVVLAGADDGLTAEQRELWSAYLSDRLADAAGLEPGSVAVSIDPDASRDRIEGGSIDRAPQEIARAWEDWIDLAALARAGARAPLVRVTRWPTPGRAARIAR